MITNLPFGCGKIVIIGDPHNDKAPSLFRAAVLYRLEKESPDFGKKRT